jgi:hypothetical protein
MTKDKLSQAINDLWYISRTALADQSDTGRYARMIYIKNELIRSYPTLIEGMTIKQVWFKIEEETLPTR